MCVRIEWLCLWSGRLIRSLLNIFLLFFARSSYDTRGQSHAEARHWSEEKILGGRAFFRGDLKPARLVIDNVKGTDAGIYRCRADFYRAPTTISHMKLDVIGIAYQIYFLFFTYLLT